MNKVLLIIFCWVISQAVAAAPISDELFSPQGTGQESAPGGGAL